MVKEEQLPKERRWPVWLALVAFIASATWFNLQILGAASDSLTYGFSAYYSASRLLQSGEISPAIYSPEYFIPIVQDDSQGQVNDIYNANPPTTSLMFLPLSFLSIEQARLAWSWLNILFLILGLVLLLWSFGVPFHGRKIWTIWFIILSYSLLFQPVVRNFTYGQAYVLIFFLISITTAAFFKNKPAAGIGLALSLLLKTAGWPLLIMLLWLRKSRHLAWVIGSGLLIFLITLPVFSPAMWLAYARLLLRVGRSPLVCVPAYQTTRSWLCHLFAPDIIWQDALGTDITIPTPATITFFALAGLFLILILKLAQKRPKPAFIATICWSVVFLPLGESHHHTVMLIPLVWFVATWAGQSSFTRLIIILGAYCYLITIQVNADQLQSGPEALFSYPYQAGAWLIFSAILWNHQSDLFSAKELSTSPAD